MPDIERTTADGISTIWFDRPDKRNALTREMWIAVGDLATELAGDPETRVVVLRGRGGHFCAGADVNSLGSDDYQAINRRAEESLAALPQPTIAFLTGSCVGGGAQLAFACDLRIADTTLKAGITPARLGIVYPAHSIERTVRHIGMSAAKHLLFSAELIDAERALRIGFVDEVHAPEQAGARLDALASLLATQRSSLTQHAAKEMIEAAMTGPIDSAIVERWQQTFTTSPDATEGIAAFLDKREPHFTWTPASDSV